MQSRIERRLSRPLALAAPLNNRFPAPVYELETCAKGES
jgi:hypothetical protein